MTSINPQMRRFNPIFDDNGRVCRKCEQYKVWSEFHAQSNGINGRMSRCRACVNRATNERNSTPEGKEKQKAGHRRRVSDPAQLEKMRERQRIASRKPERRERNNELRRTPERRAKRNKARRARLKVDVNYAIVERARGMIHRCLRAAGLGKNLPTFEMLGYGPEKLRARIECQFKPGMSWRNHSEWHIDHKKPVTAFIAQGNTNPKTINALCNLQPMWATENISKNNKWPLIAANDNYKDTSLAA